jgi:branched-chain amino acid aminotransferase
VHVPAAPAHARFAGVRLRGVVESVQVQDRPDALRTPGWWCLVGDFEGRVRAWRFAEVEPDGPSTPTPARARWRGPHPDAWRSSLSREQYVARVEQVRAAVREGDVYQANLCRVLSAPLGGVDDEPDAAALADVLAAGNPAPFAGYVHVPGGQGDEGVWVVTASPELFLRIEGDVVTSGPIKGTARTRAGLTAKDAAENVMITDLVRNDLQHVCRPGTVEVTTLLTAGPRSWRRPTRPARSRVRPSRRLSGSSNGSSPSNADRTAGSSGGCTSPPTAPCGRSSPSASGRSGGPSTRGARARCASGRGRASPGRATRTRSGPRRSSRRRGSSGSPRGRRAHPPEGTRVQGDCQTAVMSVVIWADGHLHAPTDPVVSAVDHGLTVGDGIFETCGVVGGRPFALTRHLRRLERSATGLGLPAPDEQLVRDAVAQVLAAVPEAGRLRITCTGGAGPLGSARPEDQRMTVLVLAGPATPSASCRAVRVPWVRNERSAVAGLKTTSYAENVVALAAARRRGADEALLANTVGELCEGTGSNVFVERHDELVTPPLSSGCLAGITRELVLEWARDAGLPAREGAPGELAYGVLDDVLDSRASLGVTGSVRGVSPVVALDERPVAFGDLTRTAVELYRTRASDDIDP